ncbi:MAG: hypothetical protein AAGF14_02640 [Pseudomonadota bacterium]
MQTSNRVEAKFVEPMLHELHPTFELPVGLDTARPALDHVPQDQEDDLPVGIRIALAVGLRPDGERGLFRRKSKAEKELALVGGLARTLARGSDVQNAQL